MPNSITAAGLTTSTYAELVDYYTTQFKSIYGDDINLDSDSPDGQMMNIFIQAVLDMQDLLSQVNASFDPDQAFGVTLDQRVSYNGIQRQAGTFTRTNVTLVTDRALNLSGLDQDVLPVYTVSDNAGNEWQLVQSQTIATSGTYTYEFQAAEPGAVLTVPNTITVPVSIVLGVLAVNNPTTYTSLGLNEETDAELKLRRRRSVTLSSQGYLPALQAALEAIDGVTSVSVNENNTGLTNADGVPGHSIWVIVQGGTDAEIADAIYRKRNAGAGMYGAQSLYITQPDGSLFEINWDYVTSEPLFIQFEVSSLDGENAPDIAQILEDLPSDYAPGVYEQVNINTLSTLVHAIDSNTLVTNAGFSLTSGGSYTPKLTPSSKNKQFAISAANIIITPIMLTSEDSVAEVVAGVVEVTVDVATAGTQTFTPLGGFGPYTFTLTTDGSGASVDSSTGEYTAGASPGTDVVQVEDDLGNTAEVTITVA